MSQTAAAPTPERQATACILCSLNCGIEVLVEDRRIIGIVSFTDMVLRGLYREL